MGAQAWRRSSIHRTAVPGGNRRIIHPTTLGGAEYILQEKNLRGTTELITKYLPLQGLPYKAHMVDQGSKLMHAGPSNKPIEKCRQSLRSLKSFRKSPYGVKTTESTTGFKGSVPPPTGMISRKGRPVEDITVRNTSNNQHRCHAGSA